MFLIFFLCVPAMPDIRPVIAGIRTIAILMIDDALKPFNWEAVKTFESIRHDTNSVNDSMESNSDMIPDVGLPVFARLGFRDTEVISISPYHSYRIYMYIYSIYYCKFLPIYGKLPIIMVDAIFIFNTEYAWLKKCMMKFT